MKDIIIDTLMDTAKLIPFLFITFLIMEYFEHRMNKKSKDMIKKSGKFGPIVGGILGAFPQCGFSVSATNLYATRIITMGTLISVYLSTSDEMLPILISEKADFSLIIKILSIKVVLGMIFGLIIDFFLRNKKNNYEVKDFCNEEHCHCEESIFISSIKHTINILLFIFVINFILNMGINYLGEDKISKIFLKDNILSPFISSLIGLIPNCGASVILTELYLNSTISFSSVIAGLLTSAGVGLAVLFRVNKNMKENFTIISLVYLIGAFTGVIIHLLGA